MDVQQLLRELQSKIDTGELTKTDVLRSLAIDTTEAETILDEKNKHSSITKILYTIGAIIVIVGISIFIAQIWDHLGSFSRILITLGMGLLLTVLGSNLHKQKPGQAIGPVFFTIGGTLIPSGSMVVLSELGNDFLALWPITFTFGLIFIFYLLYNYFYKHAILTFFSIAHGTMFTYLFIASLIQNARIDDEMIFAYVTMVIGVSYLLLAHAFRSGWNAKLIGILEFTGCSGFLFALFTRVIDSGFLQLLYFGVIALGLYLSIIFKSRIILILSTLFLIVHVSFITAEYFADSIGWPISLVVLGFLFIGLAYSSLAISRRFIKTKS